MLFNYRNLFFLFVTTPNGGFVLPLSFGVGALFRGKFAGGTPAYELGVVRKADLWRLLKRKQYGRLY